MELVEVVALENQPKPIQTRVEFEEIIIEAGKWEEEIESEFNSVPSVREHEVNIEKSDNEK